MAQTLTAAAKKRALEERAERGVPAKAPGLNGEIRDKMGELLREGFGRSEMPAPKDKGYKPPPPTSADAMGGAKDDPNIEITVGPDGKVVRRRRNP